MTNQYMNDKSKDIELRLMNIFKNNFGIDFEKLEAGFGEEHLLDSKIGLSPRDLIYLLRDIEKEFQITISQEDIDTGEFSSLNKLVKIISNHI